MYTFVLSIHILLAVVLVTLVLLQQGKGADIGAVMSGGANSLFGVGGASSVLVRMTTLIAICFMLTSVLLVKLAATGSVLGSKSDIVEGLDLKGLESKPAQPQNSAPSAPAPEQAQPVENAPAAQ
jgi:preprotein translocase subunit SecG